MQETRVWRRRKPTKERYGARQKRQEEKEEKATTGQSEVPFQCT